VVYTTLCQFSSVQTLTFCFDNSVYVRDIIKLMKVCKFMFLL
jgi:hypothetical protein